MQDRDVKERRSSVALFLVFAVMAAGILASGYLYYRSYDKHYRGEVERKQAAEALRESENRLRTLLGAVQAGVILQGKDGRIVHVNDVAARIFGMEPHAALGRTEWRRLNCRRRPLRRTQPPEGRRSRDRFYARARADENLLKRQPERSSHAGYLV